VTSRGALPGVDSSTGRPGSNAGASIATTDGVSLLGNSAGKPAVGDEGRGGRLRGRIALGRVSQDRSTALLSGDASRVDRSRQISTADLASLIFSRNATSL
jgi:hypothetical protein